MIKRLSLSNANVLNEISFGELMLRLIQVAYRFKLNIQPQLIMLQIGRRADLPMAAALSLILMLAVTLAWLALARWMRTDPR